MFTTVFSANAQIATENQKVFDNVYVTVNAGVTTPLSLDQIFPVNPTAGIAVGKWFSPVWGAEVEGTAWFGSHIYNRTRFGANETMVVAPVGTPITSDGPSYNFVRGHYVGVNGLVNLTNLFMGYNGTPRVFEISTMLGAGWEHVYTPNMSDKANNGFGVKTGLDLAFNLGKKKAHTLSIRPAVLWDVTGAAGTMPLQFDKRKAELYLGLAYTYHFKTSNKTHAFKTYDVGALLDENDRLKNELAAKPTEVVVEKVVTKIDTVTVNNSSNKETVFFAFNSAELDDSAKAVLDNLDKNAVYDVRGYASADGSAEYNKNLSLKRAEAVAEYLRNKGANVDTVEGLGVVGLTTGRVAVVTVK